MIWRKSAASSAGETSAAKGAAKNVLVIQLGGLGQFVLALAAAQRIREAHVGARITLLTTEATKALAEKAPYFDAVDADGKPTEPQAITGLIKRLRAAKYDVVYDLEGSSRTSNYFQGLRPWPPKWSGPTPGASYAYVDADRPNLHPLDRYARQLAAAGIACDEDTLMPDVTWVRTVLRDAPRLSPDFFGIRGDYVVLLPRAAEAESKRWPEAKYADLAGRIAAHGVTPVVMGGPEERPIGAAVAKETPRAKNLVTRADLFQCVSLFERAAFVVGDDVELMHLAAAAGAPCITFLSALNPERIAPRGKGGVVVLTAADISLLPVEQVERQLRNGGVLRHAQSA
ncbi:MAG: glycosyltransferase family 9 protein [Vitreimonas sp.]